MQASIARRDTLLALFEMVTDLRPDIAVKLLRCVKHLTRDPSMLLPLYVRYPPPSLSISITDTLFIWKSF